MPYAPGLTYDTQSLGQGIQQAGQNVATGLREMQANRLMASQAIGRFEGAAAANPELLQFLDSGQAPSQAASAYKSLVSGGNLPAAKAAILAQFADTFTSQKQAAQEAKMREAQLRQFANQENQAARQNALLNQYQNIGAGHSSMYNNQTMRAANSPLGKAAAGVAQATGQLMSPSDATDFLAKSNAPAKPGMIFPNAKALESAFPKGEYDYSMTVNPDGTVFVPTVSPRAPAQSTLPEGYEPDPATPGAIRPIKGSAGDAAANTAKAASAERLNQEVARADVILNALGQVIPRVDSLTAGFGGTILSKIAGTPARDVERIVDTIKANIGFEQLASMRKASPTGGALGQVAVKELDFLQAALGNLNTDQSPGQLKKTLGEVQKHYDLWKQAVSKGGASGGESDAPAGVAPDIWNAMTAEDKALWSK